MTPQDDAFFTAPDDPPDVPKQLPDDLAPGPVVVTPGQARRRRPESVPRPEVPALRSLGRPESWRAARSPESLLGAQYASAALRAIEILRGER